MFIKTIVKTEPKTGKRYNYYRLCQSYRIGNKTRHRSILGLGDLDELPDRTTHKLLADRIEHLLSGSLEIGLVPLPTQIETLALHFYQIIIERKLIDKSIASKPKAERKAEPAINPQAVSANYQTVDINTIEHENVREIGSEWLCYQAINQLEIRGFLQTQKWDDATINKALISLISRCVYPVSEHKTQSWLELNSSLCEMFGYASNKVSRHDLYKAASNWYKIKDASELYLSRKTNELFDIEDKIILYDLTNTYFEGRKANSSIACFGNSKEKRKDARLVALGLVTNAEGFIKYSRIYRGNIADCKTLEETVDDLSKRSSTTGRKPVVVMDAGISIDENLQMLKRKGYQYLCVSRSSIKDYCEQIKDKTPIKLSDKRDSLIEVIQIKDAENQDNILYVRSEKKALKEMSMQEHFTTHFEEGLQQIHKGIHSKGGTKKLVKVHERLGRLKEKYPSGVRFYTIEIKADEKNQNAIEITWTKKKPKTQSDEGVYFLRTNIQKIAEREFWEIYNTIREIEATFRVLKTDLNFRPIFHQNDDHTQAHLNLALIAYQVVNTIRYQLKAKGITHDWSNIVRIMNTQKSVTSTMVTKEEKKIIIRKCSKPNEKVKEIYDKLGYRYQPYSSKSVLPEK